MNSLKAYWNFLLHPNLNYKKERFPTRLLNFSVVLGIDLFISALLAWLIYGIRHSIAPDVQFHPLPVPHEKHGLLKFGLAVAIVVPLLEEITFRAHLRPGKGNFALSIVGGLYTTGVLILALNHILNTFTITIAVAVGILLLGAYFLFQRRIYLIIGRLWRRKFTRVFYLAAILFGFYHITNYTLTITFLLLSPVFVLPQMFAGLNLGYLRVRFGFWWGFLLHGLHNSIFLLLPLLLFNSGKPGDKLYKNEVVVDYPRNVIAPANYDLKIKESGKPVYNACTTGRSGIGFTHTTIGHAFAKLSGVYPSHLVFEDTTVANRVVNLYFADKAQESMDDFTMAKRFVVQQLLKKYNLRAQLCFVPAGNWILTRSQIAGERKAPSEVNGVRKTSNQIVLKDVTISDLADKIESVYHVKITCLADHRKKYTFVIPKNDITALRKVLSEKYGFNLEKADIKMTRFYISSRDK